ncbi:hypothetical protein G6W45_08200 [Campylobacter concisus]|nr:hypothetical protein [Campylobacter concisus]
MNNLQNQTKKGFKMALPFLAGLAVGGLAIAAWNKRDKIKEYAQDGFDKGKEAAKDLYKKGKSVAKDFIVKEEKKAKRGAKKIEKEAEKVVKKTRKPRAKKPAAPKAITPNDIA